MAFTVARALDIEIFGRCRLLTGQAGLENEIHWVNILEILDDLSHIEPGEFLITTAHGFTSESISKQQGMIELFSARKLAAMAIQTGHYLEEIPSSFIRLSEKHNIPLIEIPPEVSFKSLTRALMNELLHSEQLSGDKQTRDALTGRLDSELAGMNELWQRLIENENPEDLHLDLARYNIKPQGPMMVMILTISLDVSRKTEQDENAVHELLKLAGQATARNLRQQLYPFLLGPSEHYLPILIQSEALKDKNSSAELQIAEQLYEHLRLLIPRGTVRIGLSNIHNHIGELKQCLNEADKAQQAARLELLDHPNLVSFRAMNLYRLIMDIKNIETLKGIYYETAAPLLEYDRRSKGSLVLTLKVFLQFFSIKKASEELFVHRHTMRYRLQQIEELTGFNPLRPNDALQLNIGLHIYYYLKALNLLG